MPEKEVNKLNDWKGFEKEFQNESDRGCVLVGAAFLDNYLRSLIEAFLIDDPKEVGDFLDEEGHLRSFSRRIKAAYCMGLINKKANDDLGTIRKIRNKFAHELHGLSFEDNQIKGWCSSLQTRVKTLSVPSRSRFTIAVFLLSQQIALKNLELREKKEEDKNRTFISV
jgi:DNA-binding MltR family transcriptional regulator